jgi:hypothetical protein
VTCITQASDYNKVGSLLRKCESCPIRDEPEAGISFQYKMSLERVAC